MTGGDSHWPLIVIEVVLVFGGAMAFAWWQFRDLRREREKRERRSNDEHTTWMHLRSDTGRRRSPGFATR